MKYINENIYKTCQFCRQPLDDDYEVCPKCGKVLKQKTETAPEQTERTSHEEDASFVYKQEQGSKSGKTAVILSICGGALALALIICIAVIFRNGNESGGLTAETTSQTAQTAAPAAVTEATTSPVVVSMDKPQKVKLTKVTSKANSITVKWKKVKGATKYRLKVSTNKKGNRNVCYETVDADKNTATIKGLKKNTKYYVKVKAIAINYGVKVEGDYSSYVIKKTR